MGTTIITINGNKHVRYDSVQLKFIVFDVNNRFLKENNTNCGPTIPPTMYLHMLNVMSKDECLKYLKYFIY